MVTGIWKIDQAREIEVEESGLGALPPMTVMQVFRRTVEQHGHRKALTFKKNGKWISYTYQQYYDKVREFAKALIHIGVQPHECVNGMGDNTPEWTISSVGSIAAGAVPGGLYPSYSIEMCRYTSQKTNAVVVLVQHREQLDKYLELVREGSLTTLKALVMWEDAVPADIESAVPVFSFTDFVKLGETVTDATLDERIDAQHPGHCAALCFSSGTTGLPKAIMISHDNLTWASVGLQDINQSDHNDRFLSYIPIPQGASVGAEIHYPMYIGCETFFLGPDAMDGNVMAAYMRHIQPTWFMGIAKMWEEIMSRMQNDFAKYRGIKRVMTKWAIKQGTKHMDRLLGVRKDRLPHCGLRYRLAQHLVLNDFQVALGLDKCRTALAVGTPIADDVVRFFGNLGVNVFASYGQSEVCSISSSNDVDHWRLGSVGVIHPQFTTKLDETTSEVVCSGRQIFLGYLNDEEETEKKLEGGWLHSGDIGHIDQDGFLFLTGRIKELIILLNSEHVAPVPIETALKEELSALKHVMIVGEHRAHLTFLCTLHSTSSGELIDQALAVAKSIGSSATTLKEAAVCAKFRAYIQEGVDRANAVAKNDDHLIKGFTILPEQFSIETGELTSWHKLKRGEVAKMRASEIEAMYAAPAKSA